MPALTFIKTAKVFKRNERDDILTSNGEPDGEPLVEREVGPFTFRVPTLREEKDINVRTNADFSKIEGGRISTRTFYLVQACGLFPYQVNQAPDKFDWDTLSFDDARAICDAYFEGLDEVTGTKNSAQ